MKTMVALLAGLWIVSGAGAQDLDVDLQSYRLDFMQDGVRHPGYLTLVNPGDSLELDLGHAPNVAGAHELANDTTATLTQSGSFQDWVTRDVTLEIVRAGARAGRTSQPGVYQKNYRYVITPRFYSSDERLQNLSDLDAEGAAPTSYSVTTHLSIVLLSEGKLAGPVASPATLYRNLSNSDNVPRIDIRVNPARDDASDGLAPLTDVELRYVQEGSVQPLPGDPQEKLLNQDIPRIYPELKLDTNPATQEFTRSRVGTVLSYPQFKIGWERRQIRIWRLRITVTVPRLFYRFKDYDLFAIVYNPLGHQFAAMLRDVIAQSVVEAVAVTAATLILTDTYPAAVTLFCDVFQERLGINVKSLLEKTVVERAAQDMVMNSLNRFVGDLRFESNYRPSAGWYTL